MYEPSLEDAQFDPYWYIPGEVQADLETIAPIVAIAIEGDPVDVTLERFADLAAALGADLGVPIWPPTGSSSRRRRRTWRRRSRRRRA